MSSGGPPEGLRVRVPSARGGRGPEGNGAAAAAAPPAGPEANGANGAARSPPSAESTPSSSLPKYPHVLPPASQDLGGAAASTDEPLLVSRAFTSWPDPDASGATTSCIGVEPAQSRRRGRRTDGWCRDLLAKDPSLDRFCMFPIKHRELWAMYKKAVACFWTVEEVDLGADLRDWRCLTDGERHFLTHVLAFFAASDGIVLENLGLRFMAEVQAPEARAFYGCQVFMENIHSEMYSLLLETYIADSRERLRLMSAIETVPVIQAKAAWALRWIEAGDGQPPGNGSSFAKRLVAFACVEGVSSGQTRARRSRGGAQRLTRPGGARKDLLFRVVLLHLLAKEARPDARPHFLQ